MSSRRSADRTGWDTPRMMWAVNEDLDRNEREHDELREALEKLDSRLQSINRVLVGLLVSVATASVLLAVNIAILGAGP